ncbi:MAG: hypothetical protein K5855_00095 [Oscillospiraceae bacterium]|nr:hypothetical protein [Oscillospiraceae bacterium]
MKSEKTGVLSGSAQSSPDRPGFYRLPLEKFERLCYFTDMVEEKTKARRRAVRGARRLRRSRETKTDITASRAARAPLREKEKQNETDHRIHFRRSDLSDGSRGRRPGLRRGRG